MTERRSDRSLGVALRSAVGILPALLATPGAAETRRCVYSVTCTVTSPLPCPKIPMDPTIDFAELIRDARLPGVFDPGSIHVLDGKTGRRVPHALAEDFAYGDSGRVQWVIEDPAHTEYEIRFRTAGRRPPLRPPKFTPMIGTGDLLRYNAAEPRPFALPYVSRLVDLTGDGKRDLVGCWSYAYAPGWPWGGVFCYPRVGEDGTFHFGDLVRIRYTDSPDGADFKHFVSGYLHADVADLNGDGRPDLVQTSMIGPKFFGKANTDKYIHLNLNAGRRNAGGMPIFVAAGHLEHPVGWWGPVRAVDLDRDGAIDFVVGAFYRDQRVDPDRSSYWLRNTNPKGWPIRLADPIKLDAGRRPCFYDVDGDKALDAVCVVKDPDAPRPFSENRVAWRRNLGGAPPRFGPPKMLADIDVPQAFLVAAVGEGEPRGLLVSYNYYRNIAFYRHASGSQGRPRFERIDPLSDSAVVALGDQATPFPCDWDDDGDWDLLTGNGHGWVRVLVNEGTNARPAFALPQSVLSEGKPIRIFMSRVFPGLEDYFHNMGYPHPVLIDWDADGLPDLMLPNITNRIFWYQNTGTRRRPKFGPRRQVICDGYPETAETLRATANLLGADTKKWKKRVPDKLSPFYWRCRAAFGDLTGDGLADMITSDGMTREATLFVQYRDGQGNRRLRRQGALTLTDGKAFTTRLDQPGQYFLADWDGDGLLDLIFNHGPTLKTAPAVLRNVGAKTKPRFHTPVELTCFGESIKGIAKHGPYYGIGDLDGDAKPDLLACLEIGTYGFFRRTALDMKARPRFVLGDVREIGKTDGSEASRPTKQTTAEKRRVARKEAARRKRRIVFNNDGNDCRNPKPGEPKTHENFLSKRTSPLVGSQVDAIFYATGSGIDLYRHHSKETELRKNSNNNEPDWAWELGANGTDVLATMIDFGHAHDIEVFWSMRMNDTHDMHDASIRSQWKKRNPEVLMGKKGRKLWSAVNYARPEVRDKVFRILQDVATRYDVDGLELDFFRHPVFFKPQTAGKPAAQEHCDMMTGLLRRVRQMTERVAAERGRPVLIAIRVPDSVECAAAIGLDLVRWLEEDLVDILVVSGYFRLNPWETSVALGRKYGVPVYPCLSESRIRVGRSGKARTSLNCYRARATNVWDSGADGVYLFNFFDVRSPLFRELGDPATLRNKDKVYTTGARSLRTATAWGIDGPKFFNRPPILPDRPLPLAPREAIAVELRVGEDLREPETQPVVPTVELRVEVHELAEAKDVSVKVNGHPLTKSTKSSAWITYPVDPQIVRKGTNRIEVRLLESLVARPELADLLLWVHYPGAKEKGTAAK